MLPDLPVFKPKQVYVATGQYLNKLLERIQAQTPIEGDGVRFEETARGIIVHSDVVGGGAEPTISYDFQATWIESGNISIASGRVLMPDWGTPDQDDPQPVDWADAYEVAADTMAIADGESVWLKVDLVQTDLDLEGPLPEDGATSKSVYGGAGGAGGDGGGGGGGGDDGGTGDNGAAGADATGATPGGVGSNALPGGSPGEGDGEAAWGGTGGNGGAGGAGETRSFTHYSRMRSRWRRWEIYTAEFTTSTNKPAVSATELYIRLASVSGGAITQHHAGQVILTPSAATHIVA